MAVLCSMRGTDRWRNRLEGHTFEDTSNEMLYQNAMDGFEADVEPTTQLSLASNRCPGLVRAFQ